MATKKQIPAIVCGGETGRAVVFGYVDRIPNPDEPVRISGARMVLRWDSKCGGLFGLATKGPASETRITAPVDVVTDTCRQALSVTPEAAERIEQWPAYR